VELLRCHHWDFYCHRSHGRALMIFDLLWLGAPSESPILLHSGRQKKGGALLSFSRKAHNWYTITPSTSSKKSPLVLPHKILEETTPCERHGGLWGF
jgi:hypothetical protein